MRTADTVFLKHRGESRASVLCTTVPPLPRVPGLPGDRFLLTSSAKPLATLHDDDAAVKAAISDGHGSALTALWWQPVVATGTTRLGWHKTLGRSLPEPDAVAVAAPTP